MRNVALALAFLLGLSGAAFAQSTASPVQQTTQRLDAATLSAVSTNYNTVNTQAVATITPPTGQYVYIVRMEFIACQDGTATAGVNVNYTSTGLGSGATASPQWGLSIAATAEACVFRDISFGAAPFKSAITGQSVTNTSPSAATHTGFGSVIYYYLSP